MDDKNRDRLCMCGHFQSCHEMAGEVGKGSCVDEDCKCADFLAVPAPSDNPGRLCECGHREDAHAVRTEMGSKSPGTVVCMRRECTCKGFVSMPGSEPEQTQDKIGGETPEQLYKIEVEEWS